eukprot:6917812-Alexandrium_andersonii.AAC.1
MHHCRCLLRDTHGASRRAAANDDLWRSGKGKGRHLVADSMCRAHIRERLWAIRSRTYSVIQLF